MDRPLVTVRPALVRTLAGAVLVAGVVWAGIVTGRVLAPRLDDPASADAVIVLAGGGDRVGTGIELANGGVADELVFTSAWVADQGVWAARPCNSGPAPTPPRVRIVCVEPRPATTRGEARLVADLARRRGWRSLVLVVSTDQAERARTLLDRCWDGEVAIVGVDHDQGPLRRLVHELGGWFVATVDRSC